MHRTVLLVALAASLTLAGCLGDGSGLAATDPTDYDGETGRTVELRIWVDEQHQQEVFPGYTGAFWAFCAEPLNDAAEEAIEYYEGREPCSVPAPTIRVQQGDRLVVQFDVPTEVADFPHTIHWHGQYVPHQADGVPRVTQDPTGPGATYTYEYVAKRAGTLIYHCHVDTQHHIFMGLYGSIIVEPQDDELEPDVDQDYNLVLSHGNLSLMDADAGGHHSGGDGGHDGHLSYTSDGATYTARHNDRFTGAYERALPVPVKTAVGYHLPRNAQVEAALDPGTPLDELTLRLETPDGRELDVRTLTADRPHATLITPSYPGPGEHRLVLEGRGVDAAYDLTVTVPYTTGFLEAVGPGDQTSGGHISGQSGMANSPFETKFDLFMINGKSFPATLEDPDTHVKVQEGNLVRLRLTNIGFLTETMHLHGHDMLVTHKDGVPLSKEARYWVDTLLMGPGERYDVLVQADHPGKWVLHTHNPHHVTNAHQYPGGMLTMFTYEGYEDTSFQGALPGGSAATGGGGGHAGHGGHDMGDQATHPGEMKFEAMFEDEVTAADYQRNWSFPVNATPAKAALNLSLADAKALDELTLSVFDPDGNELDAVTVSGQDPSGRITLDGLAATGSYTAQVTGRAVDTTYTVDVTVTYLG